jgi:hypothetical protein
MSTERKRDGEALERERIWQQRHAAGDVNTFSPHSGIIDPRTISGLMDDMSSHPMLELLVNDMIARFGDDK